MAEAVIRRRRGSLGLGATLALLAVPFAACSGGTPGDPAGAGDDEAVSRRLRQGVEQLRLHLRGSAEAELAWCEERRSGDPEILFHGARLRLLPPADAGATEEARGMLERAAAARPESVKTHRLLYELGIAQGGDAGKHRAAVVQAYGRLGEAEMILLDRLLSGDTSLGIPQLPAAPGEEDWSRLARAAWQLLPRGGYAPGEAVTTMEEILSSHPDLSLIRLDYVKRLLVGQVRLNETRGAGGPRMSSALILDFAQSHLERVFDQSHPGSPVATEALVWLAEVAMRMGDHEQALTWLGIIMERPGTARELALRTLAKKAVVRLKQEKYDEAGRLLEQVLAELPPRAPERLRTLWLLHLARRRQGVFPFRSDLQLAGEGGGLSFTDVASRMGVDKTDGLGPSAWGDVDGDGDLDLFVSGCDSYGALYRNEGGIFTDVSREAGLFNTQSGFSATFADYDNDGDPDLYVGRDGWNGPAPNSLYRNAGDGTFTDVTAEAGLGDGGSTFVHAWSDVDRDGDIDLFLANGITGAGDTNKLYKNNGDGTFSDASEASGIREEAGTRTIGAAFGDLDGDGWPDLFVSGYYHVNRLYLNRGDGTFVESAAAAGVDGADHQSTGYVTLLLDADNDTHLDILRTSLAGWDSVLEALTDIFAMRPAAYRRQVQAHLAPKLYRNLGDGSFREATGPAGLDFPMGIMGAAAGDLNNDGRLDLYFGTGDPEVDRMEPDRMYLGGPEGVFTDMTFATGLGNVGKGHGVTMLDLDGDGDLDIYAPEGGFVHGDPWPNALYLNGLETRSHWLHVDLVGVRSNRDALGARLELEAGGMLQVREVANGEGFGSSSSPTVEFGLGPARRVDRLEIRWPSGKVQRFGAIEADRRILVMEGEAWKEMAGGVPLQWYTEPDPRYYGKVQAASFSSEAIPGDAPKLLPGARIPRRPGTRRGLRAGRDGNPERRGLRP